MYKSTASLFKGEEDGDIKSCKNESNTRQLIEQIREGDARAFKSVMREYYRELVDFAYHYVDSSHLATR